MDQTIFILSSKIISMPSTANMLKKALEWWNMLVTLAVDLVTEDVKQVWNGALWNVIENVYNVLKPVGYSLCIMSFLIGLFKVSADMVENRRIEHLFKSIIRYLLSYSVLEFGLEIIEEIAYIAQGCMRYIINVETITGLNYSIPGEVERAIKGTNSAGQIIIFVLALLVFLLIIFYGFSLILTVAGRFVRFGIVAALMPLGFSWFGGELTKDMGRSHLKSYISVCMEGLVLIVALCISAALVNNFGIEYSSNSTENTISNVYEVELDTDNGGMLVTVVNSYTGGGLSSGYYDYPSNIYKDYITDTNVDESDMIIIGNSKYYADNVGDTYTLTFEGRATNVWLEKVYDDFTSFMTGESAINEITFESSSTIILVMEWMLVLVFNIVLFVNTTKGMEQFASNLIKGG